jgi:hypothetical protein
LPGCGNNLWPGQRGLSVGCGSVLDMEEYMERPRRSWPCGSCGEAVEVWQAGYDVSCECGAQYNAFGQRLRDDWRGNPSWNDEDMGDMEGYERQHADW